MQRDIQFAASLMCMDFLHIGEQLEVLNHRANLYHIDLMDGHFCKNITLSPGFIQSCAKVATLPMDVHLMTTHPQDWLSVCAEAGAAFLSPHAETINTNAFRTFNEIERLGCKSGVVLNPATPLGYARYYLDRVELLTIMTVDVGFAGQPFIRQMLGKIEEAGNWRERHGFGYRIQIDGCCNFATFKALRDAGADVLVMGSSGLFGLHQNLNTAYDRMLAGYRQAVTG